MQTKKKQLENKTATLTLIQVANIYIMPGLI
jgi:hypothetical protein